ncbi:MAG: hypothetical protein ACJAVI_005336 [Candidatus Azotimanducaceae bacterium]|jgi:hypothetical protein
MKRGCRVFCLLKNENRTLEWNVGMERGKWNVGVVF